MEKKANGQAKRKDLSLQDKELEQEVNGKQICLKNKGLQWQAKVVCKAINGVRLD
jgi:hypothetical protein